MVETMRLLGAVALITAAAEAAPELPVWAYLLGLALPVVFGGRWYVNRKLEDAKAASENATAALTEQQIDQVQEGLRLSVLESVRDDMARQREETARAQASEKEAIAEVALLIAQHARDRSEWKNERHDFINQLRARDTEILVLRREIHDLRDEVHTLRVALGVEQERRVDNLRLNTLEERAQASENRADIAQHAAEVAKDVAVEQEHRNDDTPGHA